MSVQAAGETPLRCPYPDCGGDLAPPGPDQELRNCPDCHQVSAQCQAESRGERCGALNRPLARFCRRCGIDLGPGWPHSVWSQELSGARRGGAGVSEIGPAEVVYDLDADRRLGPEFFRGLELIEAGGRLWVSGGDGVTLLRVDPFHDRQGGARASLDRVRSGASAGPWRPVADGPWIVLASERGLIGVDLIGLDEHGRDGWTFPIWSPAEGERLVAGPVFARAAGGWQERIVAWAVATPGGLALGTARLPADGPAGPGLRVIPLAPAAGSGPAPTADGDGPGPELVATPGAAGPLILGTGEGFYTVDLPERPDGPPRVARFWDRPRADSILPGVVVVPAAEKGADSAPYAFVACQEGGRPALYVLRPGGHLPPVPAHRGVIPFADARRPGPPSVLCLDGRGVDLCSAGGALTRVAEFEAAAGVTSARGYGRLALCSGAEVAGGLLHYAMVLDLKDRRLVSFRHGPPEPGTGTNRHESTNRVVSVRTASPLVPLGRYLFRLAGHRHEGGDEESICVLRYPVQIG